MALSEVPLPSMDINVWFAKHKTATAPNVDYSKFKGRGDWMKDNPEKDKAYAEQVARAMEYVANNPTAGDSAWTVPIGKNGVPVRKAASTANVDVAPIVTGVPQMVGVVPEAEVAPVSVPAAETASGSVTPINVYPGTWLEHTVLLSEEPLNEHGPERPPIAS